MLQFRCMLQPAQEDISLRVLKQCCDQNSSLPLIRPSRCTDYRWVRLLIEYHGIISTANVSSLIAKSARNDVGPSPQFGRYQVPQQQQLDKLRTYLATSRVRGAGIDNPASESNQSITTRSSPPCLFLSLLFLHLSLLSRSLVIRFLHQPARSTG